MGCTYRPLGVALGALFLASCAGRGVETTDAAQQQPAAENAANDMVVTGSRIKVGNLEAEGQFRVGTLPSPPPPPAPAMQRAPGYWAPP